MDKIIIGICTHYRNNTLKICIEKIEEMNIPQNVIIELVITDDTKEAFGIKHFCKNNYKFKIHFNTSHTKGIAAARNSLLKKCLELKPDYIAFIDDDEYPDKNWIKNYYEYIKTSNADILAGPVISKFVDSNLKETKVPNYIYKNKLFNLHQKRNSGEPYSTCATSNVFLKTSILKNSSHKFDENFKQMSGEDIDFFARLTKIGHKLLWCKEARVYEHVTPDRCSLKYILKRQFNNGYLKIFMKKKNKNFKIKNHFNMFLNIIISTITLPFSILLGRSIFVKNLGFCAFNFGALNSTFNPKTYNFYK